MDARAAINGHADRLRTALGGTAPALRGGASIRQSEAKTGRHAMPARFAPDG
jgi:hypothetical protein